MPIIRMNRLISYAMFFCFKFALLTIRPADACVIGDRMVQVPIVSRLNQTSESHSSFSPAWIIIIQARCTLGENRGLTEACQLTGPSCLLFSELWKAAPRYSKTTCSRVENSQAISWASRGPSNLRGRDHVPITTESVFGEWECGTFCENCSFWQHLSVYIGVSAVRLWL